MTNKSLKLKCLKAIFLGSSAIGVFLSQDITAIAAAVPAQLMRAERALVKQASPGLINFDFDQSMVNGHYHNESVGVARAFFNQVGVAIPGGSTTFEEATATLSVAQKEQLKALIRQSANRLLDNPETGLKNENELKQVLTTALDDGYDVAITTNSMFPDAVITALDRLLPSEPAAGAVQTDEQRKNAEYKSKIKLVARLAPGSKNKHIEEAKQKFDNKGYNPGLVALFDDDPTNINQANTVGYTGIRVNQETNAAGPALRQLSEIVKHKVNWLVDINPTTRERGEAEGRYVEKQFFQQKFVAKAIRDRLVNNLRNEGVNVAPHETVSSVLVMNPSNEISKVQEKFQQLNNALLARVVKVNNDRFHNAFLNSFDADGDLDTANYNRFLGVLQQNEVVFSAGLKATAETSDMSLIKYNDNTIKLRAPDDIERKADLVKTLRALGYADNDITIYNNNVISFNSAALLTPTERLAPPEDEGDDADEGDEIAEAQAVLDSIRHENSDAVIGIWDDIWGRVVQQQQPVSLTEALAELKLKNPEVAVSSETEKAAQINPEDVELLMNVINNNVQDTSKTNSENHKAAVEFVKEMASQVKEQVKNVVEIGQKLKGMIGHAEVKQLAAKATEDSAIADTTPEQQAILYLSHAAENGDPIKTIQQQAQQAGVMHQANHEIVNLATANRLVAIAAGDEASLPKGVWVSGLLGVSKQGSSVDTAGYRGNVAGATIGFDAAVNEVTTIGIAYSKINSRFSHKDGKGSKTKGDSNMLSLYGQRYIGDKVTVQAILSAGRSNITSNTGKQVGPNSVKIATGKFKNRSFSAETSVSYKIATNAGVDLLPSVGIRYGSYKDGAYTETGTGVMNMSVASRSNNSLTSILGIKAIMTQRVSEYTEITPVVHASVENYFNNKRQKVKAKLGWMDGYFENTASSKPAKIGFNVGTSVLAKHKNIEMSASYNCHMRKKYQSHQGSLKLKVLF